MTDAKVDSLLEKLAQHKETHPNVTGLWREYLRLKRDKYHQVICQCEKLVEELHNIADLSPLQILLVYSLSRTSS